MRDEIEIHGLEQLERQLNKLVLEGQKSALVTALQWAAKPLHTEIKENTPEEGGGDFLKAKKTRKKQIKHRAKIWRSREGEDGNSVTVNVGYRMRGMWYTPPKGLWFLSESEFGSKEKAPLAWMRRAADKNWKLVTERFSERLALRIKKIAEQGRTK